MSKEVNFYNEKLMQDFPVPPRYMSIIRQLNLNRLDYARFSYWYNYYLLTEIDVIEQYNSLVPTIYPHPLLTSVWLNLCPKFKLFIFIIFEPRDGYTYRN